MAESRTVSVVVTLSGMTQVEVDGDLTPEALIQKVAAEWNLDMSQIAQPFAVAGDMVKGGHSLLLEGSLVSDAVGGDGAMLRVVLPLKPKG